MSDRSSTSDDDEPIYFTPACKPEDLICEGSDTEANPKAIIEKRQRYEQCAERVLRGQLPIIESARLRGPLYKDNKNEWLNPWRHREGDWWRPGSKDMLFKREDVMRRAREHGRNDMSPREALAWCRRDAERHAKEMGVDHDSGIERESTIKPEVEMFVVEETIHRNKAVGEQGDLIESIRSLTELPLPHVPESKFSMYTNIQDFEDAPVGESSISKKEDYGRESEVWTSIKRPVDAAWLKGSHILKRARWEGSTISSPTPLPHVANEKLQQKVTEAINVAQNLKIQPRSGFHIETPRQVLASRKSYASLQQQGATFDTEVSFHTNIGQQVRKQHSISSFGTGQGSANLYLFEDSPEPFPSVPIHTPAGRPTSTSRPSATNRVTSPRLPSHPRIVTVHSKDHETPGNVSFVTDVVPSSVNLEHFQFRKRRRRKTDPLEAANNTSITIGKYDQATLSESGRPKTSLQSIAMHSTPSTPHPIEKTAEPAVSQIQRAKSAMTKDSSCRSSEFDESRLTTQEEPRTTPVTMNSASRVTINRVYSTQREDIDNSWVTTQDDFNHAPNSSASMGITQIYRSSDFLPRASLLEHVNSPVSRNYKNESKPQSSPPEQPFNAQSARRPSTLSPNLLTLLGNPRKLDISVPYNHLDGSSTQSCYSTSPVSSMKHQLKSPQIRVLPQNLGSSQDSPPLTAKISNEECTSNIRDENPEIDRLSNLQKSDHSLGIETKEVVSKVDVSLSDEQTDEDTILQANQKLNIHIEPQDNGVVSEIHGDAEYLQDITQARLPQEVEEEMQEAMRAEPAPDDDLNSDPSSGQTSTSSSPAITNSLTLHNLTSIPKTRDTDQLSRSSLHHSTPLSCSEENIMSPASIQDHKDEHLPDTIVEEEILNMPPGNIAISSVSKSDLQPKQHAVSQPRSPQSPWVASESSLQVASKILATTEVTGSLSTAESPQSGWQREERPVTPDNDIIKPFRDLMTPSPPPYGSITPVIEERPSNTQLLVEAANQNPWIDDSKRKNTKRKRVSFGILDDEDPTLSQPSSQRQRRSPSPQYGAFGNKVARFDDDDDNVTDLNSFQNHFSAIRRKVEGGGGAETKSPVKRPSSIAKYKTSLSNAANVSPSSPAIDAMAEAFIAADRDSSRERYHHLTISPLRRRNSNVRKSAKTFGNEHEDLDNGDLKIQTSTPHLSTMTAPLNETSSNAKLGDSIHDDFDFLNEVEDFLGGDWSVEGELRKASSIGEGFELRVGMGVAKREGDVYSNSQRSLFAGEEGNVWS